MNQESNSYQVLARKYRPQTFDEVVGQESAAKTLKNAIQSNRVAHAYIFCGPRGVGKTSMARIFAKALNCDQGPTVTPCNECEICRSVSTGEDIDIIEIDGASNRGVDEARAIRDNVKYAPSRARFKIYIIDEAHMLTNEAFNALLKTLEEPPAHVKFFLATTDPNKLPETIRSRCQKFEFRRVDAPKIGERLREIASREECEVEDGAISLLVKASGGSVRDSQSLLDQMIAFGGERVTTADARELLGLLPLETVARLVCSIGSGDPGAALTQIDDAMSQGHDAADLVAQTIEVLRGVLLFHSCGPDHPLVAAEKETRSVFEECAASVPLAATLTSLQVLAETKRKIGFMGEARLLAEISFVRLSKQTSVRDLDDLAREIRGLRSQLSRGVPGGGRAAVSSSPGFAPPPAGGGLNRPAPARGSKPAPARSVAARSSQKGGAGSAKRETSAPASTSRKPRVDTAEPPTSGPTPEAESETSKDAPSVRPNPSAPATGGGDAGDVTGLWEQVLDRVRQRSMTVASFLADGKLLESSEGEMLLGFGSGQSFHLKMVDSPEEKRQIEADLEAVFGTPMKIGFRKVEEEQESSGGSRLGDDFGKTTDDPIAKAILDRLGGRIIKHER